MPVERIFIKDPWQLNHGSCEILQNLEVIISYKVTTSPSFVKRIRGRSFWASKSLCCCCCCFEAEPLQNEWAALALKDDPNSGWLFRVRRVLLQRSSGSFSLPWQKHSLGWSQASNFWLGQFQYGLHLSQASSLQPLLQIHIF